MTITLTRDEAQQVLDALTKFAMFDPQVAKAMTTLRARLSAPEPQPHAMQNYAHNAYEAATRAQPEPEPVAWLFQQEETGLTDCIDTQQVEWGFEKNNPRWKKIAPLYTAPPQREWVGLTDEEIRNEAKNHVFDESFFSGAVWARGQITGKNNE